MLVFQTTLNVLGSVDLSPLTGVTFPFRLHGRLQYAVLLGSLAYLGGTAAARIRQGGPCAGLAAAAAGHRFSDELGVATDDIFGKRGCPMKQVKFAPSCSCR